MQFSCLGTHREPESVVGALVGKVLAYVFGARKNEGDLQILEKGRETRILEDEDNQIHIVRFVRDMGIREIVYT